MVTLASKKQVNFINKLKNSRVLDPEALGRLEDVLLQGMPSGMASTTIKWLLKQPEKKMPSVEPGVYILVTGEIVKLQSNKAKTATYTLAWADFSGTRLTLDGTKVKAHWEYDSSLKGQLLPEMRMTVAQARKFTEVYGQCARCGRTLKAAESVEAGIGPVCARWFGGF